MEGPKPKSTRFWLVILGVLLLAAAAGGIALHAHRQTGVLVEVSQGGEVVDTLPLDRDLTRRYETAAGGYNLVEIRGGVVSVTEASCPDQICVRHGPTDRTADPIVCLPNKLVVRVLPPEGGSGQLDGVSS